jgi:threonine dehydrogenase-like Zn-dependent dehydrogenase
LLAGHIVERGDIRLVDVPEPSFAPGSRDEIIFELETACLCGSDVPWFDDEDAIYPRPVGHSLHEMIGRVVATTGSRFRVGDRVLAVPLEQRGFYERYVVHESRAIPLDPRPLPEHALLAQPLGTAIFALRKLPPLIALDVAIIGQGPMGQFFCAATRALGARRIIAIDRLASRLEISPRMGATDIVCSADRDPIEAVRSITGGRLADVTIEAVGHQHQQLNLAVDLTRQAGRILFFGVPSKTPLDGVRWHDLFVKNLTVHTSVNPDFAVDFPLAMQWIAEGRIDVGPLITHRFPVREIQAAFETFRDRREGAIKVLVDFGAGNV